MEAKGVFNLGLDGSLESIQRLSKVIALGE